MCCHVGLSSSLLLGGRFFAVSCGTDRLLVNPYSFRLSENIFMFYLALKDVSAGDGILEGRVLQNLDDVAPVSSGFIPGRTVLSFLSLLSFL